MKVRKMEIEEKFVEMERIAIWPELFSEVMKKWVAGEGRYTPVGFVLEKEGEIIGGAVLEVQDHLSPEQVILQLEGFFVREGYRRQGFGRKLLDESLRAARDEYQKKGLKVVGILIETTSLNEGAVTFYKNSLNFPYSIVTQKMGKVDTTVFLVSCE